MLDMKRAFDLFAVVLALPVMLPIGIVVAFWVAVMLGCPVIFVQGRPGMYGRPFNMYKFRSMTGERDIQGNLLPDAVRLRPLGRFLRAASLDELPELWNVLKGDMSLVGPRPLLMEYLPLYNERQKRRHDVRPGITGWAQINGRNAISWEEKFELDVWYVENQSFWLDLKILLLTLKKVIVREGISAEGEATMPKYTGSSHD